MLIPLEKTNLITGLCSLRKKKLRNEKTHNISPRPFRKVSVSPSFLSYDLTKPLTPFTSSPKAKEVHGTLPTQCTLLSSRRSLRLVFRSILQPIIKEGLPLFACHWCSHHLSGSYAPKMLRMLRIHTRGQKTLPLNATHYSTQQDDDRESVNWTQQDDDIESVNSPIWAKVDPIPRFVEISKLCSLVVGGRALQARTTPLSTSARKKTLSVLTF